jgi:hypothetical protein
MHYFRIAAVGALALVGASYLPLHSIVPAAIASDEPMRTLLKNPSELFPPAFNPAGLVKPSYEYEVADTVSTEVLHRRQITKIAYGQKSVVTVITTPTGTYSSDGLSSPHVEYPGVTKTWVDDPELGTLAMWNGDEWEPLETIAADSFAVIDNDRVDIDVLFDNDVAIVEEPGAVWDREIFPDDEPEALIHPVPLFPGYDEDEDEAQVITPLGDRADETQALEGNETLPTYPADEIGGEDGPAELPGTRL